MLTEQQGNGIRVPTPVRIALQKRNAVDLFRENDVHRTKRLRNRLYLQFSSLLQ